ncbi:hypothetical protein LJK88_06795 [Paenibacillus sp. P26]|nr:hypothetical protein LJK88_06795 [Paenibacillus sp. P26]
MMDQSLRFTTEYFEQDAPVLEQLRNYALLICGRVIKDPQTQRFYMRIGLDLHHLYEPGELSPFEWMKSFIQPMAQAVDNGIRQGVVRQGDANLMAMQFWGAISQGMNYLDQFAAGSGRPGPHGDGNQQHHEREVPADRRIGRFVFQAGLNLQIMVD